MLRFAPSPTGDMHIDHLRVALLNYLVAQQRNEGFIIRIEDTDKAHNIEGKDTEIMQILEKFALIHTSVFHQSEHLHMHQTLAIKLLEEGKAFVCTCTPEALASDRKIAKEKNIPYRYSGRCCDVKTAEHSKLKASGIPFVIRIKKPTEDIIIHDMIHGDIRSTPNDVDAFVILRADGTPTYDFASACDDMLSGVTTMIREEVYLSDTAKQKHIQTLLAYDAEIEYAHLPSILNTIGKPVKWLFQEGFIPDAIINYLLVLDNNNVAKEIFTLPEAIAGFTLDKLSKYASTFDIDTLRFINREHLKKMEDKQLSSLFGFADAAVGKLLKLYLTHEEASTINELALKIRPIFTPKVYEGAWAEEMKNIQKVIVDAPMIDSFVAFKTFISQESGLTDKELYTPLRLILTGASDGPELSDIYPLIKPYLLEIAS